MNNQEARRIDWDVPLEKLSPFILSQGGVVLVTGFETSACNMFVKLVRNAIKESGKPNMILKLNPDDQTTHYTIDVIAKLEQKLGIEDESLSNKTILKDNDVGRDMVVENSLNEISDASRIPRKNLRRTERIIKEMKSQIASRRIVLILYNYHKMVAETVSWFWNELWMDGLDELVSNGLLVLCAHESGDGSLPDKAFTIPFDCPIELPAQYDRGDRAQVLEQVTQCIIVATNKAYLEAQVMAKTLLDGWRYCPANVHGGLDLTLKKLKYNL